MLAALVLAGYAGALLLHRTPASLAALYRDVAAGRTHAVTVVGEPLPSTATGSSAVELTWRTGLRRWSLHLRTERFLARDGGTTTTADSPREEVTGDDLRSELRRRQPSLDVAQREPASGPSATAYGVDYHVPAVVLLLVLAAGVAGLALLTSGPTPWRATRWAWFWVIVLAPGGELAFLLLSGPTPGLPRPTGTRRLLTGGWALLSAGLLGAALQSVLHVVAAHLIWPPHG